MFNSTVELFLNEYFVIMATIGKFVKDGKNLFVALSKVFMIPSQAVNKLYALVNSDEIADVATMQDYMRYQRLKKYSALTNGAVADNSRIDEIIRIKGNALSYADSQKIDFKAETSRNTAYSGLLSAANSGSVVALKIIGFLQCEGIFLDKNLDEGIKNLNKTANWNDCVGALALLYYSSCNRQYNVSRLRMIVQNTPFEALYKLASKSYAVTKTQDIRQVRLLNRAFNSAILNRSVYNPMSARILYSEVLCDKDKEKAMFSNDPAKLSQMSDLPLKLSPARASAVDAASLNGVAFARSIERRKIASALNNADLRCLNEYRPLCLTCDSPFVLNAYAAAISAQVEGCNVETINVSDLSMYDVEPTSNNVFVRCIDEDKDNRLLLFFVGNAQDRVLDFARNFLQSARRAKFHLNSPNVTLDLSAVLPICFCDKRNAHLLSKTCDVVQLSEVDGDEMPAAIADIVLAKQALYGVDIAVEGDAQDVFVGYGADAAEKVIDAIARDHRKDGAKVVVNRSAVLEYNLEDNRKRIGFSA